MFIVLIGMLDILFPDDMMDREVLSSGKLVLLVAYELRSDSQI